MTENFKLDVKQWDKKVYQPWMDVFREWIASDKDGILEALNTKIFKEDWDKYAKGTISAWEMEVLCFYYHDHELKNVNTDRYGFVDFFSLPEEPEVDRVCDNESNRVYISPFVRVRNKMNCIECYQDFGSV